MTARTAAAVLPVSSPVATHLTSGDALQTGFTPGTVLGGRFRVIGLLGHGGMGEVYRADDLKLGQTVALKFLPRTLADDRSRLERLLGEVRIARQVSHPNVCRVYDVSESDALHFLSMEYVDGEDLRSLLHRIGRLPGDKALDIARQVLAGLAAAHDRGVLHRDLKPANVMLDGRGRVRITDFGLAVAVSAGATATDIAGTPAYMAPEQFSGRPASIQTDLYSFGAFLYELYTGTRPFPDASLLDLASAKELGTVMAPSELVADMDPVVERVILRCMSKDPRSRPPSAAHVAAALPGGNLLEAVLRAGETPSPELIAASGNRAGIELPVAWGLLIVAMAGAVAAAAVGATGVLWRRAAPEKSPEVLTETARETLAALGYQGAAADHAGAFEVDLDHLRHLRRHDPSRWRTRSLDPSHLRFWYRESPQPLETWRFPMQYGNVSRITPSDPPLDIGGMSLVRLDPRGRLTQLIVVPGSAADTTTVPAGEPDWSSLLARAGFESATLRRTTPGRNPPVFADSRAAWEGTWPNRPELPVRLEAATLGGRPVYFEAVFPWTPLPRMSPPVLTSTERLAIVVACFIIAATIVAAAVMALRNVRAGRGDRRGALRVSGFVFAAMMLSWLVGESHVASLWEVALIVMALSWALFAAGFCWLAYLAAEPFLRRRWPEMLVSWTRLLAGDLRDPLVGRDVLIGCASGTLLVTMGIAGIRLPEWLGQPSDLVFADVYGVAYGLQQVVPLLIWRSAQGVVVGLATVFLLLAVRVALRSKRAAAVVLVIGGSALAGAGTDTLPTFWIGFANTAVLLGVFVALLVRFGLLAAVVQFYVWGLFIFFPVTGDLGKWYGAAGFTALLVFAALVLFGFTTSIGDRPAFGRGR